MSEFKQKGLEGVLNEIKGVYTIATDEPMLGVSISTQGYAIDEIQQVYSAPEGVSVIVPKDTDPEEVVKTIYAQVDMENVTKMYADVADKENPEDLLEAVNQAYDAHGRTDDQLFNAASNSFENVYFVPRAEPKPGMYARVREYFTDLDGPQKMLLGIIGAASIGIGALVYNDIQNNGGEVLPAPVQEVQYDSCEAATQAYRTNTKASKIAELRENMQSLCE